MNRVLTSILLLLAVFGIACQAASTTAEERERIKDLNVKLTVANGRVNALVAKKQAEIDSSPEKKETLELLRQQSQLIDGIDQRCQKDKQVVGRDQNNPDTYLKCIAPPTPKK